MPYEMHSIQNLKQLKLQTRSIQDHLDLLEQHHHSMLSHQVIRMNALDQIEYVYETVPIVENSIHHISFIHSYNMKPFIPLTRPSIVMNVNERSIHSNHSRFQPFVNCIQCIHPFTNKETTISRILSRSFCPYINRIRSLINRKMKSRYICIESEKTLTKRFQQRSRWKMECIRSNRNTCSFE